MTQQEFQDLRSEIHNLFLKLDRLQEIHRKETGRDYIPYGRGMPIENHEDLRGR